LSCIRRRYNLLKLKIADLDAGFQPKFSPIVVHRERCPRFYGGAV
jgi:hypothetical protein